MRGGVGDAHPSELADGEAGAGGDVDELALPGAAAHAVGLALRGPFDEDFLDVADAGLVVGERVTLDDGGEATQAVLRDLGCDEVVTELGRRRPGVGASR